MKQDKQNEKQSEISKIKQSNDNKLEIAQELHVSKNIGNMLGYRIVYYTNLTLPTKASGSS
ncbi:DNA polymerase III [Clostridioides difficile]|uniref:DNA polymerase III n=1 Tax=Clostridioides difficile TaxID=1496 RepID=UPI000BB17BED|nr:DNA polymerase III [Clostridioides difficile]PBG72532.1 DNA polymerase III [Clostridioides difficile]